MAVDLLVADARIVLPRGEEVSGWMAIDEGRIAALGEIAPPNARQRLDCRGQVVLPGVVDIHVHFRDPDFTDKEDFTSGSAAAACGGVTTVVDMPNDELPMFTAADIRAKLARLEGRSHVDFGLYAELGDSARSVEELSRLGVVGMKWYLGYEAIAPTRVARTAIHDALSAAGQAGMMVGVHAEAATWVRDFGERGKASGHTDGSAHPRFRPPFIEALGVAEAMLAARDAGSRLHIHHLTSRAALETATALRDGLGAHLTLETCPQYLVLNGTHVEQLGSLSRVNPPLRTREDNEVLWAALANGEIDCVASDHAPHMLDAKRTASVWDADCGLLGTETLFSLLFHEVCEGRISVSRLCEITATRPASIAGLRRKGCLVPGYDADFIVVDAAAETRISAGSLHSKQPITPYEGWTRRGRISTVFLRGREVVRDGGLIGPPHGRYVNAEHVS